MGGLKRWIECHPLATWLVSGLFSAVRGWRARIHRLRWLGQVVFGRDVKLIGAGRMQFGRNVVIADRCWLNVNDLFGKGIALDIGNNSFIGQDNFFSVGKSISIGEYCLTTKGVSFVASAHIYDDPYIPYLKTGTTLDASIRVGVNCFFGIDARVMGGVIIGHGSVIGAGAVVVENVPPFSLVVGNPARVIKRYDFAEGRWVRWPAENYREGPSESEYLEHLKSSHPWLIQPVSAALSRHRDIV